jgi:hypothetical protein
MRLMFTLTMVLHARANLDDGWSRVCQARILHLEAPSVSVVVKESVLTEKQFTTHKPSLNLTATEMSIATFVHKENSSSVAASPAGSHTLAVKMKSRESALQKLNQTGTDNETCADLNGLALDAAISQLSASQLQAYEKCCAGLLTFSADDETHTGVTWIDVAHVKVEQQAAGRFSISSPRLYVPVNFPIKDISGMFYCKVLSPQCILDWILNQIPK